MDLPEADKNLVGIFVHLIIMVVFMKVALNEGSATIHYLTESSKLKQKNCSLLFYFLILEGGVLVILIDCMIFLSPFLDIIRMPISF